MFDVPGSDIVEVVITEEVVLSQKSAEYVRRSATSDCDDAEARLDSEARRSSAA